MSRQPVAAYAAQSDISADPGWVIIWDDGAKTMYAFSTSKR